MRCALKLGLSRPDRRPVRVRPVAVVAAGLAAGALALPAVATALPATPPGHKPTIASVKSTLHHLAARNDQMVEKFDQAQQRVKTDQRKADQAQTAADAARRRLAHARAALGASAAAQYESGSFSATGALLESRSGSSYLDQLDTLSLLNDHNASMVSAFRHLKVQADAATVTARHLLTQAQHQRDEVASERKKVSAQIDRYTKLLHRLTAAQRRAFLARQARAASAAQVQRAVAAAPAPQGAPSSSPSRSGSRARISVGAVPGQAQRAVNFALAQVGKPYVFGAAGPSSYDCSGLTMASYAAAGIGLPHSALMQYNYGTHVSYSQLQPGDLVFFYQPIGHVAMYIGHGMLVSAPQPGQNVMIVPLAYFRSDYVGATRLVG